jgi:hypothetical protein
MNIMLKTMLVIVGVVLGGHAVLLAQQPAKKSGQPVWMKEASAGLEKELVARYGEGIRTRLQRGVRQVADFWRAGDGDRKVFEEFVRSNFAGDQETLDTMFGRFEALLEKLDGHMGEIGRTFRTQADLDLGPILPFDEIVAGYDASAHLSDDFFENKLAFVVVLNFPFTTLEDRLANGSTWTRRQWAEARLAQRFSRRVPASVNLEIARSASESGQYIAEYNIWMHHLLNEKGERPFPPKLRLLSHWNLRDELKADYSEGAAGFEKQKTIQTVMQRIVLQTIPEVVINNPHVDWNLPANTVIPSSVMDADSKVPAGMSVSSAREPDTRYKTLLGTFLASRKADPYSPTAPTHIARSFNEGREIPETRVREMLEQVVSSPLVPRVAALIEKRLGRPLEPFDIWYNGFRQRSTYTEAQLDDIVAKRYPTPEAFQKEIPNILTQLSFTKERADFIANHIMVDPARGSGHAMGSSMREAPARLRTRVGKTGMNYKGYNIAIHELGHNVEQVISLHEVDHTLLQGVPNTAFTEALAFVFQENDLRLLGLTTPDARSEELQVLNDFWGTYEIAGVALVDMSVWHWMYDHPNATPAQLREATLGIVKEIWNTYYAPVFKQKDVVLLGIYSHMIDSFLYLPDYPIGHLIAHQINEQIHKAGSIGPEFERMAKLGRVTPDVWMKNATGSPVGSEALLHATEKALAQAEAESGKR